eukprot:GHRR01037389.1.p1 GENE.GHRR01037389.1~~GHRR01037389.1.p1  ORF type:complete len:177 (-),score=34.26 GHRR01037389.1:258-788(-)
MALLRQRHMLCSDTAFRYQQVSLHKAGRQGVGLYNEHVDVCRISYERGQAGSSYTDWFITTTTVQSSCLASTYTAEAWSAHTPVAWLSVLCHHHLCYGAAVGTPPTLPSSSSGGANGPSVHTSMTGGKHRISYGTRTPTRKVASWFAIMVLLGYLSAMVYYLYVRIAFTLDMKDKW